METTIRTNRGNLVTMWETFDGFAFTSEYNAKRYVRDATAVMHLRKRDGWLSWDEALEYIIQNF